ncbi:hypothetical protein ACWEWU_13965 [Staphylococcus xylosus]
MNLKRVLKITLLIIILIKEIRSATENRVTISQKRLTELEEFKKEYRNLVNELHFKYDDSL